MSKEYKVLITTSGVGSRLGKLTDYTNKTLVRISKKPVLSYIIEKYPPEIEFVITLGYYGNHVQEFLTLAYPKRKFTFIEVENYDGSGSSLALSMLASREYLQCPFIFHACDTIVTNKIPTPSKNWVAGSYREDSSQYRTLKCRGNELLNIEEKGAIAYDYAYIGLAGIYDYEIFWKYLNLEYLDDSSNPGLCDCHGINRMSTERHVDFIKFDEWYDIGNTTELAKTRKKFQKDFQILDKNDENTFMFDDYIIKFFHNSTIVKNRVERAKNLFPLVPKLIDSTSNFYKYQNVDGDLFSKSVTEPKFKRFLEWSTENLWVKSDKSIKKECEKFYIEKTLKRINKLQHKEENLPINGMEIPSVLELITKSKEILLSNIIPTKFHGDFILDNIIEKNNKFTLIDWRQDFGGELNSGDIYYDLAKLNHNLVINHEIVNQNNYTINIGKDNIEVDILCSNKLIECQKILHEFIKDHGYDLYKIKVLTSIIWINMAPLHQYPLGLFLFYFGKYHLYKQLKRKI